MTTDERALEQCSLLNRTKHSFKNSGPRSSLPDITKPLANMFFLTGYCLYVAGLSSPAWREEIGWVYSLWKRCDEDGCSNYIPSYDDYLFLVRLGFIMALILFTIALICLTAEVMKFRKPSFANRRLSRMCNVTTFIAEILSSTSFGLYGYKAIFHNTLGPSLLWGFAITGLAIIVYLFGSLLKAMGPVATWFLHPERVRRDYARNIVQRRRVLINSTHPDAMYRQGVLELGSRDDGCFSCCQGERVYRYSTMASASSTLDRFGRHYEEILLNENGRPLLVVHTKEGPRVTLLSSSSSSSSSFQRRPPPVTCPPPPPPSNEQPRYQSAPTRRPRTKLNITTQRNDHGDAVSSSQRAYIETPPTASLPEPPLPPPPPPSPPVSLSLPPPICCVVPSKAAPCPPERYGLSLNQVEANTLPERMKYSTMPSDIPSDFMPQSPPTPPPPPPPPPPPALQCWGASGNEYNENAQQMKFHTLPPQRIQVSPRAQSVSVKPRSKPPQQHFVT